MNHISVKSRNLHSLAHEGDVMEARFKCGKCGASGKERDASKGESCDRCSGKGHTGTYRYLGVPRHVHDAIVAGKPEREGEPRSVGSAFTRLIRNNPQIKWEKV